jgi:hypothetical protein
MHVFERLFKAKVPKSPVSRNAQSNLVRRGDNGGLQGEIADYLPTVWRAQLGHLHEWMSEHRILDREQTDDPWVLRRLEQFKCFSIEDVKLHHNRLARAQRRPDLEID